MLVLELTVFLVTYLPISTGVDINGESTSSPTGIPITSPASLPPSSLASLSTNSPALPSSSFTGSPTVVLDKVTVSQKPLTVSERTDNTPWIQTTPSPFPGGTNGDLLSTRDDTEPTLPDGCSQSLDLEHGTGIFSASDWSPGSLPNDARLNARGGWIGGFGDVHYVHVDFGSLYNVSAIRLQPHSQWPRNFVKEFRVLYSVDGFHWNRRPNQQDKSIPTHMNNKTKFESLTIFKRIFTARYVVVHPVAWTGNPGPALRMELYGCQPAFPPSSFGTVTPVVWRGDILADTTWGSGTPYLIHQMVRIWPGVTLTLAPGVEILFGNSMSGLVVEGTFVANGTEDSPISMQAYNVMSLLTAGPFWSGIILMPGGSTKSSLSHVHISGAGIGLLTAGDVAYLDNLTFERCICGLRADGKIQSISELVSSSVFQFNDNGLQVYNVTGTVHLDNLIFHSNRFMSISIIYPTLPMMTRSTDEHTNLTLTNIKITNTTYAVSISAYQPMQIELSNLDVSYAEYGTYLEYSDAVSNLSTSLRNSNFSGNTLYGVYVDYKRYARYKWYGDGGDFNMLVEKCSFSNGANGLSYFGPESLRGQKSELVVKSCEFTRLLSATILQLQEGSTYTIHGNTYKENGDRVLDVMYNALDVSGSITDNSIFNNALDDEAYGPYAEAKGNLIGFYGSTNAQFHGKLNFQYNTITNNSFSRIVETELMSISLSYNVFDNPTADCELCVVLSWIHGGNLINASHNWWGNPFLSKCQPRILDFFRDLDLAAADISPVLKEPRVRGAGWDSESLYIKPGDSIQKGGIISGNVIFSTVETVTLVTSSILVPAGNSLTIQPGTQLKFAKDIGILVSGEIQVLGNQEKPVILSSAVESRYISSSWKGIRLLYPKVATFHHTAVSNGRGVQCVGFVPEVEGLDVTFSTGPGLWIYVVQPSAPIQLRNSYFMNNTDGIYLQIQGNGTDDFTLEISDCHFANNNETGLKIEAGNVISHINITGNIFTGNSLYGASLKLGDGSVTLATNSFNESSGSESERPSSKLNDSSLAGMQVSIEFDDRCTATGVRNVTFISNTFHSASRPLQGVRIASKCINATSTWAALSNKFINAFDGNAGEAASLVLSSEEPTIPPNIWPLVIAVGNNTFECVRQNGVGIRLYAYYGEDVFLHENNFFGCGSPTQVIARYNSHRLGVTHNRIVGCGPMVFNAAGTLHSLTIPSNGSTTVTDSPSTSTLEFSYNNASRGNGSASLKTTGYDAEIYYNFFENPAPPYDLWVGDLAPVNATLNWWGTEDFNRILSRVLDGRTDFTRAEAVIFPCLLSANYSHVSTAFPDVFQVTDGVIGGSVKGNISLPATTNVYEVQYPIRVPYGSILTIPPGTTLRFRNQTGIYALGHLVMDGTADKWIVMEPANGTTKWKGITIGKPRHEFMRVRLTGSSAENAGRVEVFVAGAWVGVCADKFDRADAHVVCKELGFTDISTVSSVPSSNSNIGLSNVRCIGLEMSVLDCEATLGSGATCLGGQIAAIVCDSQENDGRVRRSLADGSDGLPTIVNYVRIIEADIGLQIKDVDGVQLNHIDISKSRGPGMILNPETPHGVQVSDSLITSGQDVGVDVRGTGPITLTSTNITSNSRSGINVASLIPNDKIQLTGCAIQDNKMRGFYISSEGNVNLTRCYVQRNAEVGGVMRASSIAFYKTLIEDHSIRGTTLNATSGSITIANTAFVNNGGTDVDIELTVPGKENVTGLMFYQSALVNSTFYTRPTVTDRFYAMHIKVSSNPGAGQIPIAFKDCRVLDAFSDGVWILGGRSQLSVEVTNSTFEHIAGTAVHVETIEFSPELTVQANEFNYVEKETVEVEVRS